MIAENRTCFDSFRVHYIPKGSEQFIGNKYVITNIYKIQACDLVMFEYFCIGIIDFMLKGRECTNLFSPNDYFKRKMIT